MDDEVLAFITEKLSTALSLSDETYAEYITQLALDDSIEKDEKGAIIKEFLEDATEEDTGSFVDDILKEAAEIVAKKTAEALKEVEEAVQVPEPVIEREETLLEPTKASTAKPALSKEERRRREMILAKYDYDVGEIVEGADGEAEIVYKGVSEGPSLKGTMPVNDNAQRVKEAERLRREKLKAEHEHKVARDKAANEKRLLEKEKEKKRTMKKEKRRM
ncbi:hypothetical protein HDV05_003487 [Chytridiales sp. JEL 0842]|nr:hypothetical protein HDV05_003487 [Chytridiales sp. JEL 0842]